MVKNKEIKDKTVDIEKSQEIQLAGNAYQKRGFEIFECLWLRE